MEGIVFPQGSKLRDVERAVVLETLKDKGFNRTHTARTLGIGLTPAERQLRREADL